MHLRFYHPRELVRRGVSCTLVLSFLFSRAGVVRARQTSPVFDTHTVPDPTPCDAVTFSWTGGVPPFALFLGDPDTVDIVDDMEDIDDHSVTWTPPRMAVGMTLLAMLFDDDLSFDTTNSFVVQPASCLSASPPPSSVPPASSVSLRPSTSPAPHPPPSISIPPIRNTTDSSGSPSPPPSAGSSEHVPPSTSPNPSPSSPSNTSTTTTGNSTTPAHPTTGPPSSTEPSPPSSPSSQSAKTSHRRATWRPHRKSSADSPSAGEIVGIVLGSVALVCALLGILVWRRMVLRGSARDSRSPAGSDGSVDASSLQSSSSLTLSPQPAAEASPLSTKATPLRHPGPHLECCSTGSPTMHGGTGLHPTPLQDEDRDGDGGEVLHIHNSTEVNTDSVAVEPPTSHLIDNAPILSFNRDSSSSPVAIYPPGLVCAGKTAAPIPTGDGNATEPGSTPTRSNARGGLRSPGPDTAGISTEGEPDLTLTRTTQTEGEVSQSIEGAPGPSSRARRRVTLVLLETDGGVRLAGLPPDVTIEVEPAAVESFSDSDGPVGVDITRLPPPYHRYNS